MRPQTVTVSSQAASAPIPLDWRQVPFNVSLACVVPSGTLTFKVQHTFDNLLDPTVTPTWFDHSTITGKNASTDGNYAFPVTAVRLNVTSYTSGFVTLTVLQGAQK